MVSPLQGSNTFAAPSVKQAGAAGTPVTAPGIAQAPPEVEIQLKKIIQGFLDSLPADKREGLAQFVEKAAPAAGAAGAGAATYLCMSCIMGAMGGAAIGKEIGNAVGKKAGEAIRGGNNETAKAADSGKAGGAHH